MTVSEFAAKNSLSVLSLPDGEREICGGYTGDLLSWVMGRAKADCAWVTIMSNQNIVAVAALADVACIILAEGVTLTEDIIETAKSKNINILSGEADAFTLCALLSKEI